MAARFIGTVELTGSDGKTHIACQFQSLSLVSCARNGSPVSIWRLRDGRPLETKDELTFWDNNGRRYELPR